MSTQRRLVFKVEISPEFLKAMLKLFQNLKITTVAVKVDTTGIIFSGQSTTSPPIIAGVKGTVASVAESPTRQYRFALNQLEQVISSSDGVPMWDVTVHEDVTARVMTFTPSEEYTQATQTIEFPVT